MSLVPELEASPPPILTSELLLALRRPGREEGALREEGEEHAEQQAEQAGYAGERGERQEGEECAEEEAERVEQQAENAESDAERTEREEDTERISFSEITAATEGRAHGLLLLLLALPETIPMIGFSLILAIPVFLIGVLMVRHGPSFPLPRWLGRRTMKRSLLDKTIDHTLPTLRRLDRILKPRWTRVAEAGRLQGTVCILMAVVLAVPIPGINIMAAFAVAGMGLGILQHDGRTIAVASGVALLTLLVIGGGVTGVGLLVGGG